MPKIINEPTRKSKNPSTKRKKGDSPTQQNLKDKSITAQSVETSQGATNASGKVAIAAIVATLIVGALIITIEPNPDLKQRIQFNAIQEEKNKQQARVIILKDEIAKLQKSRSSAEDAAFTHQSEASSIRNTIEYEKIAMTGVAGSTEGLMVAKKMMDNPSYMRNLQTKLEKHESDYKNQMDRAKAIDAQIKPFEVELAEIEVSRRPASN